MMKLTSCVNLTVIRSKLLHETSEMKRMCDLKIRKLQQLYWLCVFRVLNRSSKQLVKAKSDC